MTIRARCLAIAASIAAVLCVAPASSMADTTKDECVDANAKAQDLRRDGKLAAARAELRACADASCPAMVRADCTRRLDDLENAQPSLVFDVKDTAGSDLIDVRVSADGQPLADHLDGKPINVDPGPHRFTFDVAGRPLVNEQLLVKEGEAGRHEHIVIGNPAPGPSGFGAQKVVGLSLVGIGVVGLGVGTAFGLMASSAWESAKNACGGDISRCATYTRAKVASRRRLNARHRRMKVGLAGGTAVTLTSSSVVDPFDVALYGTNVYFSLPLSGVVMSVPIAGGAPVAIASGQGSAYGPAVDSSGIYWPTYGRGTVMMAPLGGGTPVTIASNVGAPGAIAVDAINVYWTSYGTNGFVARVAK